MHNLSSDWVQDQKKITTSMNIHIAQAIADAAIAVSHGMT